MRTLFLICTVILSGVVLLEAQNQNHEDSWSALAIAVEVEYSIYPEDDGISSINVAKKYLSLKEQMIGQTIIIDGISHNFIKSPMRQNTQFTKYLMHASRFNPYNPRKYGYNGQFAPQDYSMWVPQLKVFIDL